MVEVAVQSKRRGKPSNRRLPDALRQKVLKIIDSSYKDFSVAHTYELLLERHTEELMQTFSYRDATHLDDKCRLAQKPQIKFDRLFISCVRAANTFGEMIQIDGRMSVLYKGQEISYSVCYKGIVLPPCEDAKSINDRVDRAFLIRHHGKAQTIESASMEEMEPSFFTPRFP